MNYQMEDLTLDDIRSASSNYLRSCLKEDIAPELSDMIDKELYVREQRRAIVPGVEYIQDSLESGTPSPHWGFFIVIIKEY